MMLLLDGDPVAGLNYPDTLHETEFPCARSPDLATQIQMIWEKYEWMYPQVHLHVLKHGEVAESSSSGVGQGEVQEFADAVNYDDLYGETVPDGYGATLAAETNPHSDLAVDATSTKKYFDPFWIHVHLNHTPTLKELKEFGIKEEHESALIATFLLPMLLQRGHVPGMAAQFPWKRHWYRVKTYKRVGYWKNTSAHLYLKCLCHLKTYGS